MIDNISGDTSGMGHQKFDNLKTDGVAQGFEHDDQSILGFSGNFQGTALSWNSCLNLGHTSAIL
jgi:hypothetical protein